MKQVFWKRHWRRVADPTLGILMALSLGALTTGCGSGTATVLTSPQTKPASTAAATQAAGSTATTTTTQPISSAYPNLDEADVSNAQSVAEAAYSASWADGSGVSVTWGPNIVSGWALLGLENTSGAAGKDVLLHKEGGSWVVKDIGHALASTWSSQTPPELWPQT